jgi:hypothetical protein
MVTPWRQRKKDVSQLAVHLETWIKGKYGRGIYHQREQYASKKRNNKLVGIGWSRGGLL